MDGFVCLLEQAIILPFMVGRCCALIKASQNTRLLHDSREWTLETGRYSASKSTENIGLAVCTDSTGGRHLGNQFEGPFWLPHHLWFYQLCAHSHSLTALLHLYRYALFPSTLLTNCTGQVLVGKGTIALQQNSWVITLPYDNNTAWRKRECGDSTMATGQAGHDSFQKRSAIQ